MTDFTLEVLGRLERWGSARGWIGADPYEGLNSPLARLAPSRRTRQAVVQLYRRFPFDPPWPLRTMPSANAKALALALSAYATPVGQTLPGAERYLTQLPQHLAQLNLRRDGAAWGYPFDVQTRSIYYTRETPNAIATCFVVEGLIDAFEATAEDPLARLAISARPFLLSLLKERPVAGRFFAYVESGSQLIHNANMLVCGALARLHGLDPDPNAASAVIEAAQTTLSLQREDGLWPYGEADNLTWRDNFHTAYTLEGTARISAVFGLGSDSLARGVRAWQARFFEQDGAARYHPGRRYPLEPHCYASTIDLLTMVNGGDSQLDLAVHVARSAIDELWMPDARHFAYRRTRLGRNPRPFMRWTNAPMFRSLARLATALAAEPQPSRTTTYSPTSHR